MHSILILSKLNSSCKSINQIKNKFPWFDWANCSLIFLMSDDGNIGEIHIFENNFFVIWNWDFGLRLSPVCCRATDDGFRVRNPKFPSLDQSIFDIFPPHYPIWIFLNFIEMIGFLFSHQILIDVILLEYFSWSYQNRMSTDFMNGWLCFSQKLIQILDLSTLSNPVLINILLFQIGFPFWVSYHNSYFSLVFFFQLYERY